MFERLLAWMKSAVAVMLGPGGGNQHRAEPVVGDRMPQAVALWCEVYRGQAPWNHKGLPSLRIAAAIASELARQMTLELQSEITGSARAEYLGEQYRPVLDRLRVAAEYGCAGGGLVFKPYPDGCGGLAVDLVQADAFAPLDFDGRGRMTAAVFVETLSRGREVFRRYEYHALEGERYTVHNIAYRSTNPGMQGAPVPLDSVPEWAQLAEETVIEGVKQPLFGYFRVTQANTVDPRSPLGASVYSRAVDLLKQADEQWARIIWEYEGGEMAVDASEDLFQVGENGRYRLPKGKERLFRLHDISVMEARGKFIETFAPALRDTSMFNGLNQIFKRVELLCGLAYGTLSDPQMIEKTAEEIKAGKQRSYATVADLQKAMQAALEDLVYAMDIWADLYQLAPPGAYEISFNWDDSIVTDADTERQRDLQEVRDGLMQKWEYRVKWRGEDEATARVMAAELPTDDELMFGGGG